MTFPGHFGILGERDGERRWLVPMNSNEDFWAGTQRGPEKSGNYAEGACGAVEARRWASCRSSVPKLGRTRPPLSARGLPDRADGQDCRRLARCAVLSRKPPAAGREDRGGPGTARSRLSRVPQGAGSKSGQQAKMKVLRDPLGRPIDRLYFKTDELDDRCERKIADFMDQHCGGFRLPIPTDDLVRMIEWTRTTSTCTPTLQKKRTGTLISSPTGSPK